MNCSVPGYVTVCFVHRNITDSHIFAVGINWKRTCTRQWCGGGSIAKASSKRFTPAVGKVSFIDANSLFGCFLNPELGFSSFLGNRVPMLVAMVQLLYLIRSA